MAQAVLFEEFRWRVGSVASRDFPKAANWFLM
jgi:hypothetical protein